MHRTYLADVERGVRNLSLSSIARLVGAIGVSLSEFFASLENVEPTENGSRAVHRVSAGASRRKGRAGARAGRRSGN